MACKTTNIPIKDIIKELVKAMNLDDYVKVQSGTLNNPTLRGQVALDETAKQALCNALAQCILSQLDTSDFVTGGSFSGGNLLLKNGNDTLATIDLTGLIPAAKADRFLSNVEYSVATKQLVFTTSAEDEPNTTFQVSLQDLVDVVDPASLAGDGLEVKSNKLAVKLGDGLRLNGGRVVLDQQPCTMAVKTVGAYTAAVEDDIILCTGGEVNFPTSLPVGKAFTVFQTTDTQVTLSSNGAIKAPRGGSLKLKGKDAAVTVVKVTENEWRVVGDT